MTKNNETVSHHQCRVKEDSLRWSVDLDWLEFADTSELTYQDTIIGQEVAKEALKFSIECSAYGQNAYVRGISGTGKLTTVKQLFNEIKPKARQKLDRCYVHNFKSPEKPRLISLEVGLAKKFKARVLDMANYIENELEDALNADHMMKRRSAIQEKMKKNIEAIQKPLEDDMKANNMALVAVKAGNATQQAIFPLVEGKPIPPEQFHQMIDSGEVPAEAKENFEKHYSNYQNKIHTLSRDVNKIMEEATQQALQLNESEAQTLLSAHGEKIKSNLCQQENGEKKTSQCLKNVEIFIAEIINDVIENRIKRQSQKISNELYDVNIIFESSTEELAPVIIETAPNSANIIGTIEASWTHEGPKQLDYKGIHAGSLLRADGGYLVIDAKDVISEPGAWRSLMRALSTKQLDIVPTEVGMFGGISAIKPEPIDIDVRVILLGDGGTYYLLDRNDPDFSELFKVLADFDSQISRGKSGVQQYAQVLANIIHEEKLPDFTKEAVAVVLEHSARVVSKKGKLTAKFSRVADIMREAAYLANRCEKATKDGVCLVDASHVDEAISRTKARASLPSVKFQEMVNEGTINVQTRGETVGQINGLAVIHSGPITYGFPSRITSTIGPGRAGLINIEGQASMSGSIHTKGFHIIGGLLRHVLKLDHPMAFTASIAFEQSYGGIDGDSASGAETVCLLSALTNIPVKQTVAMTGAIDQHGHIQAIGGVNEKVEGFFDACLFDGLTGDQCAIIPTSNAGDLMLRKDVVNACKEGKFAIYAVSTIHEALEIATGYPAGTLIDGEYAENTMLHAARDKIKEYWRSSSKSPFAKNKKDDSDV